MISSSRGREEMKKLEMDFADGLNANSLGALLERFECYIDEIKIKVRGPGGGASAVYLTLNEGVGDKIIHDILEAYDQGNTGMTLEELMEVHVIE
jgi:ribosomal protein S11